MEHVTRRPYPLIFPSLLALGARERLAGALALAALLWLAVFWAVS